MEEVSAGGIVIKNQKVLCLKKRNGDWVLPKGRIEIGEDKEETALREVFEETGVRAKLEKYIGVVKYNYIGINKAKINKTVYYFYMSKLDDTNMNPLKKEGFIDVAYLNFDIAIKTLKYNAEINMTEKAIELSKKWKL